MGWTSAPTHGTAACPARHSSQEEIMSSLDPTTSPQRTGDGGAGSRGDDRADPFDPTGLFADLGRLLSERRDFADVLHEIAELAAARGPGAEGCSVTLTSGSSGYSPAAAGELGPPPGEKQVKPRQGARLHARSPR